MRTVDRRNRPGVKNRHQRERKAACGIPVRPLIFERLEDRRLLATIDWVDEGQSGLFSDASKWSAGVPGIEDEARFGSGKRGSGKRG